MSQIVNSNVFELRESAVTDTVSDQHDPSAVGQEQSLAPYDGGARAWTLLLAAWVFEALLWGMTLKASWIVMVEFVY